MPKTRFEFDVAVSFAGEDRATVERFVTLLDKHDLKVFYDMWEQAHLWGKDLYQHLDEVYTKKARFCVLFISAAYAAKAWTRHELKSAQARAFKENQEYILPVRLDDTAIPGIRETVAYIDLRNVSVEELAKMTLTKLGGDTKTKRETKSNAAKRQSSRGKTQPIIVEDSQDWVLLDDQFYQALTVDRPDDKHFLLQLRPTDPQQDARLEALRGQRSGKLSFAYASDAFIVRCQSATSTYEGQRHKWQIKLVKEDVQYGGGFMEPSLGTGSRHYSVEDIVQMRAQRILLGMHPVKPPKKGGTFDVSGGTLEMFIQGMHTPLKVTHCPIQELAKTMPRDDAARFMRFARLVSLFYLKAGGVVEHVERLAFGPLTKESMHVVFRGLRGKKYANVPAERIEIEGDCPLVQA